METITRTATRTVAANANTESIIVRFFRAQEKALDVNRFAWMTMLITIQSCLGSIACQWLLQSDASTALLALCAAVTMASNAMFIAQASARYCLVAVYLSVITNLAIIIANL